MDELVLACFGWRYIGILCYAALAGLCVQAGFVVYAVISLLGVLATKRRRVLCCAVFSSLRACRLYLYPRGRFLRGYPSWHLVSLGSVARTRLAVTPLVGRPSFSFVLFCMRRGFLLASGFNFPIATFSLTAQGQLLDRLIN